MKRKRKLQDNQIAIYETEDGKIKIGVLFFEENLWLTQKLMAELFETTTPNVNMHLKSIFKEKELEQEAVIKDFLITASDGKKYKTKHYSIEAIIAIGYRVNTIRGIQFRIWATDKLKNYIIKGWALDKDRFIHGSRFDARYFDELMEDIREIRASERMSYQKITDIYATSIDYSANVEETKKFFATVQNKLHFAITGQTAAEIIVSRASKTKQYMGLTTWKKFPKGKIRKSDAGIAKNYLQKDEIKNLNHIVDMYLDYAELQASRGRPMYMKNWIEKLNAFLKFSEYEILNDRGKISHEVAIALAEKEFDAFRVKQDVNYFSDFDKIIKKLKSDK